MGLGQSGVRRQGEPVMAGRLVVSLTLGRQTSVIDVEPCQVRLECLRLLIAPSGFVVPAKLLE